MKVRFRGGNELAARLRQIAGEMPDRVGRAMKEELQIEAAECRRRVPVKTGDLQRSIRVEGPKREGNRISCEIVAGNEDVQYAVYVHEDPDAFHPNGQWKFIESVIQESTPYIAARIAARIKEDVP